MIMMTVDDIRKRVNNGRRIKGAGVQTSTFAPKSTPLQLSATSHTPAEGYTHERTRTNIQRVKCW